MPKGLYLVLRNSIYCVHGSVNGQRLRLSTKTNDKALADIFLEDVRREYLSGWRSGYSEESISWKSVATFICNRHRSSARARQIPFQIKTSLIFDLMSQTGFKCAVSGIPFSKRIRGDGIVDPWSPSIDRIENRHGYVPDNVRVVCVTANMAMNQFGYDVLLRLSKGVVRNASVVVPEHSELLTQNMNSDSHPTKLTNCAISEIH